LPAIIYHVRTIFDRWQAANKKVKTGRLWEAQENGKQLTEIYLIFRTDTPVRLSFLGGNFSIISRRRAAKRPLGLTWHQLNRRLSDPAKGSHTTLAPPHPHAPPSLATAQCWGHVKRVVGFTPAD